jgi:hypothetical protein
VGQVEVKLGTIRLKFECLPVIADRRRQLPLLYFCIAEVVEGLRMMGLQLQYAAKTGFRFVQLALVGLHVCEAVQRVNMIGVQREGAAIAFGGGAQIVAETVGIGEIVVIVG